MFPFDDVIMQYKMNNAIFCSTDVIFLDTSLSMANQMRGFYFGLTGRPYGSMEIDKMGGLRIDFLELVASSLIAVDDDDFF